MAVDFHAYFQPQVLLDELRQRDHYPMVRPVEGGEAVFTAPGAGRPLRPEQSNIEARLALMDRAGVRQQILRVQNVGGIDALEPERAKAMARAVNVEVAGIAHAHPGRFLPFAAVPGTDPVAASEELAYAVEVLGHGGMGLSCHFNGKGVDDPDFRPIWERAEKLRVPILLLPNHPPLLQSHLAPDLWLAGAFGFQVDLTWAVLRLLHAGILDRYPNVPVIVANLGGVLISISERLDEYWHRVHTGSRTLSSLPSEALQHFYYETASAHPAAIAAAGRIFGVERLLFGSDFPSFSLERGMQNIQEAGLSETDLHLILEGNATRLKQGG